MNVGGNKKLPMSRAALLAGENEPGNSEFTTRAVDLIDKIMAGFATDDDVRQLTEVMSELAPEVAGEVLNRDDFVDYVMRRVVEDVASGSEEVLMCTLRLYHLIVARVDAKAMPFVVMPEIVAALNSCITPSRGSKVIRMALWCMAYGAYEANRRMTLIRYDLSYDMFMAMTAAFPELTEDVVRCAEFLVTGAPMQDPYVVGIMKTWFVKYSPLYDPRPLFEFLLQYITECDIDDTIFEGLVESGFMAKVKAYMCPTKRIAQLAETRHYLVDLQVRALKLMTLVLQKNKQIVNRVHEFVFPEELAAIVSDLKNDERVIVEAIKLLCVVAEITEWKPELSWMMTTLFSSGIIEICKACLDNGAYSARVNTLVLIEHLLTHASEHPELLSDEFIDNILSRDLIDPECESLAAAALSCATQILCRRESSGNFGPTPTLADSAFRDALESIIEGTACTRVRDRASALSIQIAKLESHCV